MNQKLTISFEETQKSVNAIMKLEIESEGEHNDAVIAEAKRIFEDIQKYSRLKTSQKAL